MNLKRSCESKKKINLSSTCTYPGHTCGPDSSPCAQTLLVPVNGTPKRGDLELRWTYYSCNFVMWKVLEDRIKTISKLLLIPRIHVGSVIRERLPGHVHFDCYHRDQRQMRKLTCYSEAICMLSQHISSQWAIHVVKLPKAATMNGKKNTKNPYDNLHDAISLRFTVDLLTG